jgi:hypothetical protein
MLPNPPHRIPCHHERQPVADDQWERRLGPKKLDYDSQRQHLGGLARFTHQAPCTAFQRLPKLARLYTDSITYLQVPFLLSDLRALCKPVPPRNYCATRR